MFVQDAMSQCGEWEVALVRTEKDPGPSQEKDRHWFPALGVALCTQLPPGHSPGLNQLGDR